MNLLSFLSLRVILLVSIFRLALDYGYFKFVYPVFAYDGFHFNFDALTYVVSWIALLAVLFLLERRRDSSLIYIFSLIYVVVLLPSTSYYALGGDHSEAFWANWVAYIIIVMTLPRVRLDGGVKTKQSHVVTLPRVRLDGRVKTKQRQSILVELAAVGFLLFSVVYLIAFTGGRFVIAFEDVYQFRDDNLGAYAGMFGYFISWAMKVVAPFLLAVALVRKSVAGVVFNVFLIVLLYIFTGHKSAFLPIVLCGLLSILLGDDATLQDDRFLVVLLGGLIGSSFLGFILYFSYGEIMFSSVFFRRVFFTPAFLNGVYFEMFDSFNFVYWSDSVLSSFLNYGFDDTVSHEVGAYIGRVGMGANTGFIASGFMQAGYWGIAVYVLIVIAFNAVINSISARVSPVVLNAVLFMPFLTLFSSSDLPTTIFTHGLGISLVLLGFYGGAIRFRRMPA